MQEVNAIKYNGIVLFVFIKRLHKISRMLGPVHGLLYMVGNMIAIIPALMIVLCINAGNTVLVMVAGIGSIDKCMLCPVTEHRHKTEQEERDKKYHYSCLPVDKAHSCTE